MTDQYESRILKAFGSLILCTCLVQSIASYAFAQTPSDFAVEFGELLGSEKGCGLSFDQAAVAKVVSEVVSPDDLGFGSTMSAYVSLTERRLEQMSASQKTAHCTAAAMNAKHYGLIK